jgi:type IX secretion system PorP/SprF family membrane protein
MKKITLTLFVLLTFHFGFTQDALYSQFNYTPTYFNPGLVGTGKDFIRLSAVTKLQWLNLYKPYKYLFGGIDYAIYDDNGVNILNIGANVNAQSKGYITNTNISGIVGRSFGANASCKEWYLNIALQAGYNFARVNPSQFVFIDQLNQNGITGLPSDVELFKTINSKNYFDFSSGFVFTYKKFMVGTAVHHMNEPATSFVGTPDDSKLPKKITSHLSYSYENVYNVLAFKPTIITQFQGKSSVVSAGAIFDYAEFPIEFGLWYRNAIGLSNNSSFCLGITWKLGKKMALLEKGQYTSRVGLNYDVDMYRPGVKTTFGSMEVGMQKDFNLKKGDILCPTSNSGSCNVLFPWQFF